MDPAAVTVITVEWKCYGAKCFENRKKCIANIHGSIFRHVDKVQMPKSCVSCFYCLKNASNEVKLVQKMALVRPGLFQCYIA